MTTTQARTAKDKIVNVVLYLRVSTEKQAEKDLSIPAQRREMEGHCKQRGYTIVGEYVEAGASARDDARPVFKRMIAEVLTDSSKVNAILVFTTSRFMRNTYKAQLYKEKLRRAGVRVIAIQQPVSDDAHGHLLETVFEAFDQFESEINGVRVGAAMRENARQGNFNGSVAPYGFRVVKTEIRPSVFRGKLEPCTEEIAIVREVLRMYVAGSGAKGTARELNQRCIRGRNGKLWTRDSVLRVISDEALVGIYYWGRMDGRTGQPRPKEEWIATPVAPIVDRELFDLVQRLRAERDPEKHPGRQSSSPLLLARLVKCGKCGSCYTLETCGKGYRYYNCRRFTRTGKEACSGFRIPAPKLESAVLEHIAEKFFSVERCREILRDLVEETGIMRQKTLEQKRQLEHDVTDLAKRIQRWEEILETHKDDADVVLPRLRELRAKRDELKTTLEKIVPLRPVPPHLYSEATIRKFLEQLRDMFFAHDSTMTRNYLRFLVDEITINGPEITIHARGEAVVGLMAAGGENAGPLNPGDRVLTSVSSGWAKKDSNLQPTD